MLGVEVSRIALFAALQECRSYIRSEVVCYVRRIKTLPSADMTSQLTIIMMSAK